MRELIRHIIREHLMEQNLKKTTDEFIQQAKKVHGDKYDYSKVNYTGQNNDVIIICPIHGEFSQKPAKHRSGSECRKCSGNYVPNTDEFIKRCEEIHQDENGSPIYDYSQTEYVNSRTKVTVICPKHGPFEVLSNHHIQGSGCEKCASEKQSKRMSKDQDWFVTKVSQIHQDENGNPKFDYSQTDFKNTRDKVTIICPVHGPFEMRANAHILGQGCPICQESSGERLVNNILVSNQLKFLRQHKFIDCTNKKIGRGCRKLPFDFYIPNFNTCIEYDGRQHFEPSVFFKGEDALKKQQLTDEIKNQYCEENGIKLIRIPYTMKKEDIEPYILSELGM